MGEKCNVVVVGAEDNKVLMKNRQLALMSMSLMHLCDLFQVKCCNPKLCEPAEVLGVKTLSSKMIHSSEF